MAVRSLLTTGAAFATAGMVALVPAIAPPLAPRDIQVIKQTEAQVNLAAQLTLQDLINVFFGVTPQGAYPTNPPTPGDILLPEVTDAPGTAGAAGVIYQLLYNQQGGYLPGQVGLTQFFNGGLAAYVQLMLVSQNTDPAQQAGINAFFAGLSQLAYEYLKTGTTNTESLTYLASLFGQGDFGGSAATSGIPGVILLRLLAGFQAPEQQAFLTNLAEGGVSQLAYQQLGGDMDVEDEEGEPTPTDTPYLSAFFGINNNIIDPDGSGSPSLTGASGVVYTRLKAAQATGDLTPEQMSVIDPFFNGGASEVARVQLLSRTTDPNQINLINEFFDNGVSGVVRYLLVGPEPVDPTPPPPPEEEEEEMLTLAKAGPAVDDTDVTPVAKVEAPEAPTAPAPADPAPAAAAAAPAPAGDGEQKPAFTAKVRDQSVAEEKAAETDDPGTNKAEPEIIIGGGPNPGSGSWGVLGQIAQGVHDAIAGMSAPAPADPGPSPDAGDAGGDAGGEG